MAETREKKQRISDEFNDLCENGEDDGWDFTRMHYDDLLEIQQMLKDKKRVEILIMNLLLRFQKEDAQAAAPQVAAPAQPQAQQTIVDDAQKSPAAVQAPLNPQAQVQAVLTKIKKRPIVQMMQGLGIDPTKVGSGENAEILMNLWKQSKD